MKNNIYPINPSHQDPELFVKLLNQHRKQQARESRRQITLEELAMLTASSSKPIQQLRHYERAISYVCGLLATYSIVATVVAVVLALLH